MLHAFEFLLRIIHVVLKDNDGFNRILTFMCLVLVSSVWLYDILHKMKFLYDHGHFIRKAAWIKETICNNHSAPKPTFCCGSFQSQIEIVLKTDNKGKGNSWVLKEKKQGNNQKFQVVKKVKKLDNDQVYQHSFEDVSLTSCFMFTIYDKFGDGLCCEHGKGFIKILLDGKK